MPTLYDKAGKPRYFDTVEDTRAALRSGEYSAGSEGIQVNDPTLGEVSVSADQLLSSSSRGSTAGAPTTLAKEVQAGEETAYTTIGERAKALGEGFASGLTFGGSDWLLEHGYGADTAKRAQYNPLERIAGEVGSYLVPGVGPLKALKAVTPAGALLGATSKIAARGGLAARMTAEAIEGAAFNVGQINKEIALSDKEYTASAAFGEFIKGGLVGGGLGAVGGAVGYGLSKVGTTKNLDDLPAFSKDLDGTMAATEYTQASNELYKHSDDLVERLQQQQKVSVWHEAPEFKGAAKVVRQHTDDILREGNRVATKLEKEIPINYPGVPKQVADTIRKWGTPEEIALLESKEPQAVIDLYNSIAGKAAYKSVTPKLADAADETRNLMLKHRGIIERRRAASRIREAMTAEQGVSYLDEIGGTAVPRQGAFSGDREVSIRLAGLQDQIQQGADLAKMKIRLRHTEEAVSGAIEKLAGQGRSYSAPAIEGLEDLISTKRALDAKFGGEITVEKIMALQGREAHEADALLSNYLKAIDKLSPDDPVVEALTNRMASARLVNKDVASLLDPSLHPAIAELGAATTAGGTKTARGRTWMQTMTRAGLVGASGRWGYDVLSSLGAPRILRAAGGAIGAQIGFKLAQLAERLVGLDSKAVERGIDAANRLAGKAARATGKAARYAAPTALSTLTNYSFSDEQRKKPTNLQAAFRDRFEELSSFVANPRSQLQMHNKLASVMGVSMGVADELEMLSMKVANFLWERAPKDPGTMIRLGVSEWKPTEAQIRTWARYWRGAMEPMDVIEGTSRGRVTPEEAEAVRMLHPALVRQFQAQILNNLDEYRKNISYQGRIRVGILFGVPLDPLTRPGFLQMMQSNYEMQAANNKPMPQKGAPNPEALSQAQELLAR